MKSFQFGLYVLFLGLLASCNNSGSSGKTLTADEIRQQEIDRVKSAPSSKDYSEIIKADRFEIEKSNLSYDEQKEMYQEGCDVTDQVYHKSVYKLDSSLKPGAEFTKEFAFSEILRESSWSKSNILVTSVVANNVVKESNYEFLKLSEAMPFASPNEIFQSRPHIVDTTTYDFKNDGGYPTSNSDLKYQLTPNAESWIAANSGSNNKGWSCTIRKSTSNTYVIDRGTYLIMGRMVQSYRKTSTSTGVVSCRNYINTQGSSDVNDDDYIEMGEGTSVNVSIDSNKVGIDSWARCGGNDIYSSHVVKLNNGKILSSYVDKYSKLPLK